MVSCILAEVHLMTLKHMIEREVTVWFIGRVNYVAAVFRSFILDGATKITLCNIGFDGNSLFSWRQVRASGTPGAYRQPHPVLHVRLPFLYDACCREVLITY